MLESVAALGDAAASSRARLRRLSHRKQHNLRHLRPRRTVTSALPPPADAEVESLLQMSCIYTICDPSLRLQGAKSWVSSTALPSALSHHSMRPRHARPFPRPSRSRPS